jgi:hypothetical protein
VLLISLTPVVMAGALYAVWLALRENKGRELVTIVAIWAVVQFYQIITGGVMSFARYTITLGTLLTIMSGFGLERLSRRLPSPLAAHKFALLGAFLAVNLAAILVVSETRNPLSEKMASLSPRLRFTHSIEEVSRYLRPRLRPEDNVVIDNYNGESGLIVVASGLPLLPGSRAFLGTTSRGPELPAYLHSYRPRYLVYSDRGILQPYLSLPQDCSLPATYLNVQFRCVLQNKVYRVYELKYP